MSENETTALVPVAQMTIDEVATVSKAMVASGYFKDADAISKAMVKILAGREMGFGPFASMVGINIIKSKPAIGGNLMAAAVKRHPRYDYRVVVIDDDVCELAFFEGKQELGRSIFTKEDAVAAETGKLVAPGASKNMLSRFARNMYFNRAMSNGVKWFCPDVFLGTTVYTPEELGATVDADGEILDLKPTVIRSPAPTDAPGTTPAGKDANDNGDNGKKKGISLDSVAMTALLEGGLADGPQNAAAMVNLSTILNNDSTTEEIVAWATIYRAARDEGAGTAKAAKQADAQVSVEAGAEGGDG